MHDKHCYIVENTLKKYTGRATQFVADEQIRIIGKSAFAVNENLRIAKFPYDIDKVEDQAFQECPELTIVEFSGSLKRIGAASFLFCPKLLYVEIPDGLKSIDSAAFQGTGIVRFDMPASVERAGRACFASCCSLERITLSEKLPRISGNMFYYCKSLREITIPDNVTEICDSGFGSCSSLEKVTFGKGVKIIGKSAFSGCSVLEEMRFPDGLEEIENLAFFSCGKLKTVYFPDSCKKIGKNTFCNCKSLKNFLCSDSPESFKDSALEVIWNAFFNSDKKIEMLSSMLKNYRSVISAEKELVKKIKANKAKIIRYAIAEDDAGILDGLFFLYEKIGIGDINEYISISSDSHETMAFLLSYKDDHYTLKEQEDFETDRIEKELGLKERTLGEWKKIYNFEKHKNSETGEEYICLYGYKGKETVVIVPEKIGGLPVREIGTGAFSPISGKLTADVAETRKKITTIVLPYTIERISEAAFLWCESLESIDVPDSVSYLAKSAFSYCEALSSVTLPSGIKAIEDGTFMHCKSLENITLPENLKIIEKDAFAFCENLRRIKFPDGVTRIGDSAFRCCERLSAVELSESLLIIDDYAFIYCKSLSSITVPDSVKIIGKRTFDRCEKLFDVKLSERCISIGANVLQETAFYKNPDNWEKGCLYAGKYLIDSKRGSDEYKIREGTTLIAGSAISHRGVKHVEIPSSVKFIGEAAFEGCTNLDSLIINEGVEHIGDDAFYFCKNLYNISIPESVRYIGNDAFTATARLRAFDESQETALYIDNCLLDVKENAEGIFNVRQGTRVIAGKAFEKCAELTSVVVCSSVENICSRAFDLCKKLKSIRILPGTKRIYNYAFLRCYSLKNVLLPASVEYISESAFDENTSATICSDRNTYAYEYAKSSDIKHKCLVFDRE